MTTARLPVGVDARQHHRVGLGDAELDHLGQPPGELGDRIGSQIGLVETDIRVLRSQSRHLLGVHLQHLGILSRTCSFIPHSSGDNVETAAHEPAARVRSEECR